MKPGDDIVAGQSGRFPPNKAGTNVPVRGLCLQADSAPEVVRPGTPQVPMAWNARIGARVSPA